MIVLNTTGQEGSEEYANGSKVIYFYFTLLVHCRIGHHIIMSHSVAGYSNGKYALQH